MPDIGHAVTVNAALVSTSTGVADWGTPVIVGKSTFATKNTPKLYYTASAVHAEHGGTSDIGVAATSIFAQGVRKCYVVSIEVVSAGAPTVEEIETALATLTNYATEYLIDGVCLAGISDVDLLAELKAFADANKIIFTATHAPGDTVGDIVTIRDSVKSENGYFVAYADAEPVDDVAAVALGRLLTLKPWVTPLWKPVVMDTKAFFSPTDLVTLENGNVNALILLPGKVCLSNGLTTKGTPLYIDVTRTKYYITRQCQLAVANLRMQMEKIPYTQNGIDYVKGALGSALVEIQRAGAITGFTVTVPAFESISDADKAARRLSGIAVSVLLAGEIHTFTIDLAVMM